MELDYHVETNTLREEQAQELVRLVESSGVFDLEQDELPPNPDAAAGPADVISYRLSVSDGARQTTLWFNDVTAPASLRPLVEFLEKRALEQRRD